MYSRPNKYQAMGDDEMRHKASPEMGLRFWAEYDRRFNSRANPIALSNAQFASSDPLFMKCCDLAKVRATKRQASKFRNMKGSARNFVNQARESVA